MAITKDSWKMLFYGIISVLLLFGQIRLLTSFGGDLLRLELLGFLVLLAMYVAGLVLYPRGCGEKMLFWGFLLYLINLLALWIVIGTMSIILLVVALIGFISTIPKHKSKCNCPKKCDCNNNEEPHNQVFESQATPQFKTELKEAKKTEAKKEVKESAPKPSVKFIPGKYVASKSSNVYHEPKCDWAKKIRKERQVWFASKEDAWEKGYKKHDCVKEE